MSSDNEGGPKAPASTAKKPMSRFLKGSDSDDSSSESDDEEEMSSGDEEAPEQKKKSRFLAGQSDDEDSDEDAKRVVKSAKDKRLEEMEGTGKVIDNALKINDWLAISSGTIIHRSVLRFVPIHFPPRI